MDSVMRVSFLCLLATTVFLAGCAPDKKVSRKRSGRKPQPKEVHSAPGFSSLTYAEAPSAITESGDEGKEATAKTVLRDAIAEAKASDKQLFVHFGAQW